MRLQEVDVKTFKGYKETKIRTILKRFAESGITVAEVLVDDGEYKNATSAYSALNNSIKRFKMGNISVRCVDKRVYLINLIQFDKELEE